MSGGNRESRNERQDRVRDDECCRHREQVEAMDRLSQALDGIAGSIRQAGRNIARSANNGPFETTVGLGRGE